MSALGSCHDPQALLLGFLAGGDNAQAAGGVHTHRLLHEDVFARLDRGLEVDGTEDRRGGEEDHVHVGLHHLLVAVEADEAAVVGHLEAALLEEFAGLGEAVGVDVTQGGDCH